MRAPPRLMRPASHVLLTLAALASGTSLDRASSLLRRIEPALDPVSSDAFFRKDYPDDLAPKVAHHFDHPFPTVQDDDRYDRDFVRDENDDGGEWRAQSEYDRLRSQLRKEELEAAAARKASEAARAEWEQAKAQEAAAEQRAQAAETTAGAARSEEAAAERQVEAVEGNDGSGGAVGDAVEEVEKEVQDLKDCEEKLAKARKKLEELQGQRKEAEGTEAEKEMKEADAEVAEVAAETQEANFESRVAEEGKEHEEALKKLKKEEADVQRVKAQLEAAAKNLRKFRKQVDPNGGVYRSAAASQTGATLAMAVVVLLTLP